MRAKQRIFVLSFLLAFFMIGSSSEGSERSVFWTIRVNPELVNTSPSIQGLWKPGKASSKNLLFFGIFDDKKIMEQALTEIKKLDESAAPEQLDSYPNNAVFIPVKKSIILADLGYRLPLQIRGVQGMAGIHIPWSQNMSLKGAKGVLFIKFPQSTFQHPSTLTIYVENVPVKVVELNQTFKSPLIVDLSEIGNVDIGDFLDISLVTSITITGDKCVDDQTGNAWIAVEPNSFFEISYYPIFSNLGDVIRNPFERLNIVLPSEKPKNEDLTSLISFSSLIGAMHPYSTKTMFSFGGYSLTSPNIILQDSADDAKIMGHDVVVSPNGLLAMVKSFKTASMSLSNWKKVQTSQSANGKTTARTEREIRFSDIGIIPPTLRGIGDLQFSVPFSIAFLGGFPSKLIVTLIYNHTPVTKEDRAFIKVRLNGVLVASKLITSAETRENSFSFELPSNLLQTRNTMDVTFAYFINRGECKGSLPDMEVSISPESFFSVIKPSANSTLENFDTFPGLLTGEGLLILGESSPTFIELAAKLSEKLGKIRREPLLVKTLPFENLSQQGQPESPFIIAVVKASQSNILDPIVDTSDRFLIKNPQTGQVILDVKTDDNVAVWQVFRGKQKTTVGMLSISDAIANSKSSAELLKGLRIEGSANVAVWTQTGAPCVDDKTYWESAWKNFEVGEKMQVIMPGKKGVSYYWTRYRVYGFVILGVLLFVFLWYVYRKLA